MSISKRLVALEAALPPDSEGKAKAKAKMKELLEFLKATFPEDVRRSRMDDLANCCGLPSARYMSYVLAEGATPAVFAANAQKAAKSSWLIPGESPEDAWTDSSPKDNWQELMLQTAESNLSIVHDKHGDDGILKLARLFPLIFYALEAAGATAPGKTEGNHA